MASGGKPRKSGTSVTRKARAGHGALMAWRRVRRDRTDLVDLVGVDDGDGDDISDGNE